MGTKKLWVEELIKKFYRNAGKKSDEDKKIDDQKDYTENNETKLSNDNNQNWNTFWTVN